jgi:hypothetical protein
MRCICNGGGLGSSATAKISFNGTLLIDPSVLPITFGIWYNPVTGNGSPTPWLITDTVGNFARLVGGPTFTGTNGTDSFSIAAGTETAGAWEFVICRLVSATNRWISSLNTSTGAITHTQDTTLCALSGCNTLDVCSHSFSGNSDSILLANEFWYLGSDVQSDGGQIAAGLFWQLAYYGPFSVPYLSQSVIEYKTLRQDPSARGRIQDTYVRSDKIPPIWTQVTSAGSGATATIACGSNVPLNGRYIRPRQTNVALVPE